MITLWRDKQILPESMFQPKDSGFGSRRQVIIYLYRYTHTIGNHTTDRTGILCYALFCYVSPLTRKGNNTVIFGRQLSIVGMGLWPVYFGAIKRDMSEFPKESGAIWRCQDAKNPPRRSNVRCISFTCISPLKLPTCHEHTPYTWGSGPGNSLW